MLDAGYATAEALVRRLFKDVEITPQMQAAARDPKTELQEWLQGRKMKLPIYRIVGTLGAGGAQHAPVTAGTACAALATVAAHNAGPAVAAGTAGTTGTADPDRSQTGPSEQ